MNFDSGVKRRAGILKVITETNKKVYTHINLTTTYTCEASLAVSVPIVVVWTVTPIASKAYSGDSEEYAASFFKL
jgi:hypothetical protein